MFIYTYGMNFPYTLNTCVLLKVEVLKDKCRCHIIIFTSSSLHTVNINSFKPKV